MIRSSKNLASTSRFEYYGFIGGYMELLMKAFLVGFISFVANFVVGMMSKEPVSELTTSIIALVSFLIVFGSGF